MNSDSGQSFSSGNIIFRALGNIYKNKLVPLLLGTISIIGLIYRQHQISALSKKSTFELISVSKYCTESEAQLIFPAGILHPADAVAISLETAERHNFPSAPVRTDPVWLFQATNVLLMGESDILFTRKGAISPDHYPHPEKISREERMGFFTITGSNLHIAHHNQTQMQSLESAISLVGVPSINWAHWLTEMLPKVAVVAEHSHLKNIPIILDSQIPESMIDSVRYILGANREYHHVERGKKIFLQHVFSVSPVANVVYEFRDPLSMNRGDFCFCTQSLLLLRDRLATTFKENAEPQSRIYIKRRNGSVRPLLNNDKVEQLMVEYGFSVIEPETMSFSDQARTFSNAAVIYGQAGAGMMNIMFAPKGCIVGIITRLSAMYNYFYFAHVGDILGLSVTHLFGERVETGEPETLLDGFCVDIEGLKRSLDALDAPR